MLKTLITGAGGTIGSEIARQVDGEKVLLDHCEYALYKIHREVGGAPVLGNMTNINVLVSIGKTDKVYHSAAYKHVNMVEMNPIEGIYNNVVSTYNLSLITKFVLISSDKASNPKSVMGMTKRFCELLSETSVRFGNVLGSSGSVLPMWEYQMKNGLPLTVTHKDAYRYFMSKEDAVKMVLRASKGISVLDMGDPVSIYEMAKKVSDNIEIIGLQKGEKLTEEISTKKLIPTEDPKIFKINEPTYPLGEIYDAVEEIKYFYGLYNLTGMLNVLKRYV
jgi:FlaA1/EpsC-like NDP-sugar epimerase